MVEEGNETVRESVSVYDLSGMGRARAPVPPTLRQSPRNVGDMGPVLLRYVASQKTTRKKEGQRMKEFCEHCGAGIGKFRRDGEGTCPRCDPPLYENNYYPHVTRVEVIDEKGRSYVNWGSDIVQVQTQTQDEGKTLKIFITKKKNKKEEQDGGKI